MVSFRLLSDKLRNRLERAERNAMRTTTDAMARAVTWWGQQAIPRIPVRAARGKGQYSRHGRGWLKKHTGTFIETTDRDEIHGGLRVDQAAWYGRFLYYGTKRIAGGAVAAWRPGKSLITTWPAKEEGGNPRGAMPILRPWHEEARARVIDAARAKII